MSSRPNIFGDTKGREAALDSRTSLKSIGMQMLHKIMGRSNRHPVGHQSDEVKPKEPGVIANMAGWLLWHTPIGMPLARQFAQRMKLVERLIAAGDVDSALKLALQLGKPKDQSKAKNRYPTRLPGMRTSLDFNIGMGRSAPIMSDGNYNNLRSQYYDLAQRLERDGDFKRAAYVRAQLQGNYHDGVQTLARGGFFLDAAKLAVSAKLPPGIAIEMFYRAGEVDTALGLAKRADCFDQLAEDSRKRDPEFHAYVLSAWTDRLVETGQVIRALQVTDELASDAKADPMLLKLRLSWIDMLMDEADDIELSSEVIVRAFYSGEWAGKPELLQAFARDNPLEGSSREERVLHALHDRLSLSFDEVDSVVDLLLRFADQRSAAQTSFWNEAATTVMEPLVLAAITRSQGQMAKGQIDGLKSLLRGAKLEVLATDLNKLKLQAHNYLPNEKSWVLPSSIVENAVATHGCILANDLILVWRISGLLQLLDVRGKLVWQGRMTAIQALIPIGIGGDVLIVQKDKEGQILTRFSTSKRTYYPIGSVNLLAWHDVTSDGQWLVQIGEEIGALDIPKLCAKQPEIEFLWSCKLTSTVQVVSFSHSSQHVEWLTCDISGTRRHGLIEGWVFHHDQNLHSFIIRFQSENKITMPQRRFWYWKTFSQISPMIQQGWKSHTVKWSEAEEDLACASLEMARNAGLECEDHFLSCDRFRAIIEMSRQTEGKPALTTCRSPNAPKRALTITHDPEAALQCLARGTAPIKAKGVNGDRSNIILFSVSDGRLLRVDMERMSVAVL